MKHEYRIIKNTNAINIPAPGSQGPPEPNARLDQAINDIHSRANHVGSVLEGIIQAHPCDSKKNK